MPLDARRGAGALAVAVLAASLPGCLSPVPLDPVPQADLDARIVRAWSCLPAKGSEDGAPSKLTIWRIREKVYVVEVGEMGEDPDDRYEIHASLVNGRTIVNVRDVDAKETPWDFADYDFIRPDVLLIRLMTEDAYKGVALTPAGIRERIGQPDAFSDFQVCVPLLKKD